jgi:chromosome segregation ATPase
MSFKDALEKHAVWFGIGLVAIGVTGGVGVSEYLRVAPKAERIAELERKATELKELSSGADNCQRDLAKQTSARTELESKLRDTQSALNQWKASLEEWKSANAELQRGLNQASANCSVLSQVRDVERRKDLAEHSMRLDMNNDASGARQRAAETRRQAEEYQARLLQLQGKLSCESGG